MSKSGPARRDISSDNDLAVRLVRREVGAFEELIRQQGPRLLGLARRLVGNHSDAQDCFQDAMTSVYRNINQFEQRSSLASWAYRIMVNACLAHLRKRKQNQKKEDEFNRRLPRFDDRDCRIGESRIRPTPADELMLRQEVREQVRSAINELPDSYRVVLVLRDIEERDAGEVAKLLGIEKNLLKVRLHRARAALKKHLEPVMLRGQSQ